MPRLQLAKSATSAPLPQELQNTKLVSKLSSAGQLYSIHVLPNANSPVPRTANTAYIKMDSPNRLNGFSLYADGQRIGSLRFGAIADMGRLNRVDNHARGQYKGVGQAMEEMTCRLTKSLCKSTEVDLYSELDATVFHFKMGFRFQNEAKNEYIKDHIRAGSINNIDKQKLGYGDMSLDTRIAETNPDSPRKMAKVMSKPIEPFTL